MIYLYRIFSLPVLLLALPWYVFRTWRRGGHLIGLIDRLGCVRKVPRKSDSVKRIWIQAVSVGELVAVSPLLKLIAGDSQLEVVLTTTTRTGLQFVQQNLLALTTWSGMFPLDFWLFSRMAWARLQPDLAVLMETELWPEHIRQAKRHKVPMVVLNGRFSDSSFAQYHRLRHLLKPFFKDITCVMAGSASDAKRFQQLNWLAADSIIDDGNLKLDLEFSMQSDAFVRHELMDALGIAGIGENSRVLLGASIWPGEETVLAHCHMRLRSQHPELRLLLVPRHPERKAAFRDALAQLGAEARFRSEGQSANTDSIYVADTMNELRRFTEIADWVFVGKSLPPHVGGQTPIEAAALAKPILFGPEMSNFRDLATALLRNGGAIQVCDRESLHGELAALVADPARCQQMGTANRELILHSRGATRRAHRLIRELAGIDPADDTG